VLGAVPVKRDGFLFSYLQCMGVPLLYRLSEMAITVAWEKKIDTEIHARVMELDRLVTAKPFPGWIENLPAFHTLTIYYDPIRSDRDVMAYLRGLIENMGEGATVRGRSVQIPVRYNVTECPALAEAAALLQLSIQGLVELHTSRTYRVYMLGFMPGFPYMGLLPEALIIPRRAEPVRMKAGTVAIGGMQTGIYPFDSPGGWYGIGKTEVPMFRNGKAYLEPGDEVQFVAE